MTYKKIRNYLLKNGFKVIDMTMQGDEVFKKDDIKFAVYEAGKW